ncbi:MAG: hypothetical protein QXR26_07645 [Candidatus Caldarchaeum sp.]
MAKAVVSTVDDPWLKRRWSLAEASRCERLLNTERQHVFDFLLTRLGLSRGVRVFRLTDLLTAYRERLSLSKNDENDVKVLSMMDGDCFTDVTAEYVKLKKILDEYNKQLNLLKLLKQLKAPAETVKLIRRKKERLARQIIRMAKITLNKYDAICRQLGYHTKASMEKQPNPKQ